MRIFLSNWIIIWKLPLLTNRNTSFCDIFSLPIIYLFFKYNYLKWLEKWSTKQTKGTWRKSTVKIKTNVSELKKQQSHFTITSLFLWKWKTVKSIKKKIIEQVVLSYIWKNKPSSKLWKTRENEIFYNKYNCKNELQKYWDSKLTKYSGKLELCASMSTPSNLSER